MTRQPRLRPVLVLVFPAMACVELSGQCIFPSVMQVSSSCTAVTVNVAFTLCDAVPPYAYAISVDGSQYLGGGNDPCGFSYQVPWSGNTTVTSISVTVADNVGCNTGAFWSSSLGRTQTGLTYSMTLDCTTGLRTLRWTNANAACGSAASHMVTVDGNAGPLPNFFTQESASVWRYNNQLIAGPHTFGVDASPGGPYAGYNCGNNVQCWAPDPSGVVQIYAPYVQPGDCGVNFQLNAALQGPMGTNGEMSEALRNGGLVPLTEPYTSLGYSYTGSPSLAAVPPYWMTTPQWAIVDWTVVELRSALNPSTVVYSRPVFITKTGRVRDKNFYLPIPGTLDENLNFPVAAGNYYIAVCHRNHLGIMTAAPIALDDEPELLDLRLANTPVYGNNARVLVGGHWCLWSGDATGNGTISYTGAGNDRDAILVAIGGGTPTATITGQYRREDVNLDGVVKYTGVNNDRDVILTNVGGSTPTNTRVQQLP